MTNKMQRYIMVFITINSLHVSGGSSAHHQELKTVYTASGICRAFVLLVAILSELKLRFQLTTATRSTKSSTNTRFYVYIFRRIAWLGHVMRMDEKRISKRILEWKPTGRRIRGRPRKRWVEDTEEDIQALGIRGWRKLSKERMEWRRITDKAKTHSGL